MQETANTRVYELIAQAFVKEGVDTVFALLGDGNMHWAITMADKYGVKLVSMRHENSAVVAADAYQRATGRIGIASTTSGPGFTQTLTAIVSAVRRRAPMIIFAGDVPRGRAFHPQHLDIRRFAEAAGAAFVSVSAPDKINDAVAEAFYLAHAHRTPVVFAPPTDLQTQTIEAVKPYRTSETVLPRTQRVQPDPEILLEAKKMLREAKRPIILGGRGAYDAGATQVLLELADRTGALLATSLNAKGMFDTSPFNIGVAGGFATDCARAFFAEADLVVGVGARLGYFTTTHTGSLFPNAAVLQIDVAPKGVSESVPVAHLHMQADAKAGVSALVDALDRDDFNADGFRSSSVAAKIAQASPDDYSFVLEAQTMDPRELMAEVDRVIPKDWDIVMGIGHFAGFSSFLSGRAPERYHICHEFAAIGQGLPAAIAVAAARGDGKVLLIEGDGSLLMTVQELETIVRENIKLVILTFNDGAYGAEVHKLTQTDIGHNRVVFGRGRFPEIARGFGLNSGMITKPGQLTSLLDAYCDGEGAALWDGHISANIATRLWRRFFWGEA